jgi:hypothetical protein
MAIGTAIGALASLFISAYGMYKQEEENERARKAFEEETTTGKQEFGAQIGLRRAELQQRQQEYKSTAISRHNVTTIVYQ